jgi:hypothetical protein
MANDIWSSNEIDAIVADYFAMLMAELSGAHYSKTEHRNRLMTIIDRAKGSVEFKHQNISAVLLGLGFPWIEGYKPASNFQGALVDGVLRFLHRQPDWLESVCLPRQSSSYVKDSSPLWVGPPPTFSNMGPALDVTKITALARKFDVAERDARNLKLGKAGEECVLDSERMILRLGGQPELAEQVRWVSQEDGDGAGFDIYSFELDGSPRLIEVKTTNGWERTPFHLSRNELAVANENKDIWHLVRLWNFARVPKAYAIRPPLETHIELTPTSFLAALH